MFKTKNELLDWDLKKDTYEWYKKCCAFYFTKGEGCSCSDCVIGTLIAHIKEIKGENNGSKK